MKEQKVLRQRRAHRDLDELVALGPALLVGITALVVVPGLAGGFRLTKWSAFGFLLAIVAVALRFREAPVRLPRSLWALGALVAAATVLPAFSASLSPAHWPNAQTWLAGLALAFVTANALVDGRTRRVASITLVGSGVLCAAVVLLQAAGLRWLTSDVYTGLEFRSPGTFGNPNWAAAYLAPLVPLALALAQDAKARKRGLFFGIAALLAVATLLTVSKAGAVSLVAGLVVYGAIGQSVPVHQRFALLSLCALGVLVGLGVAWQNGFFAEAPWLRGRLFLWRAALILIDEHPFTGIGLGGYNGAYGRAAAALIAGDPHAFMPLSSVDFLHHDLLQFAVEGGLVTALLFVVVVVLALRSAHRQGDALSRAAGGALAALVVNGFADSPLRVPTTFVLFCFLLGWLSAVAPKTQAAKAKSGAPSHEASAKALAIGPAVALVALVTVLGLLQGIRFAAGSAAWTRGRDALIAKQPAVADLEQARFWIPEHGRSASQYAVALARAGRFEEALEAFEDAAALRFDFDDEIFRRDIEGRFLDQAAQIANWRAFSARFPALVTPYLRLGMLQLVSDRAAAIAALEAVLRSPQQTPRAEAARAQARKLLQALSAKPQRGRK